VKPSSRTEEASCRNVLVANAAYSGKANKVVGKRRVVLGSLCQLEALSIACRRRRELAGGAMGIAKAAEARSDGNLKLRPRQTQCFFEDLTCPRDEALPEEQVAPRPQQSDERRRLSQLQVDSFTGSDVGLRLVRVARGFGNVGQTVKSAGPIAAVPELPRCCQRLVEHFGGLMEITTIEEEVAKGHEDKRSKQSVP